MVSSYQDIYFGEDVITMECNSRDFQRRIGVINGNAEVICDFIRSCSIAGGMPSSVIKDIFYPKWTTRDKYESCRVKHSRLNGEGDVRGGGFGGLFTISFMTASAKPVLGP